MISLPLLSTDCIATVMGAAIDALECVPFHLT